jgi:hypothetical protein
MIYLIIKRIVEKAVTLVSDPQCIFLLGSQFILCQTNINSNVMEKRISSQGLELLLLFQSLRKSPFDKKMVINASANQPSTVDVSALQRSLKKALRFMICTISPLWFPVGLSRNHSSVVIDSMGGAASIANSRK